MTHSHLIRNLSTLVQLRSTEVERLQGVMAEKASVRARYQKSVERLTGLYTGSGASGALPLALSINCGDYKQAVMQLVDTHRTDLNLHEADMAHTQKSLNAAFARREVLGQVLAQEHGEAARQRQRQERKQHDELATQLWFRGQK